MKILIIVSDAVYTFDLPANPDADRFIVAYLQALAQPVDREQPITAAAAPVAACDVLNADRS
jgi:hypothetical protein